MLDRMFNDYSRKEIMEDFTSQEDILWGFKRGFLRIEGKADKKFISKLSKKYDRKKSWEPKLKGLINRLRGYEGLRICIFDSNKIKPTEIEKEMEKIHSGYLAEIINFEDRILVKYYN